MSVQEMIQQAKTLSIEEQAHLIKALVDMVAQPQSPDENVEKPFDKSVWEQDWVQAEMRQFLQNSEPIELVAGTQNKYIGDIANYVKTSGAGEKLIQKTLNLLQLLARETQPYQTLDMPPIGISSPEDDEILIGWSIPHVRIGFSVEGEGDESSWYAVTDGTIDATNAWGYLNDYESEEKLVAFLVSYIVGTYRKYNR